MRVPAILTCLAALAAPAAAAAPLVVPVPAIEGQPASHLKARVVAYSGHTNGDITVEVTNTGATAETFLAQGLYFVPEGPANEAPQRVGAVGPILPEGATARQAHLEVPPGARVKVHLDVYCIDSHRHSPSPSTQFNLATTRMPRELAGQIAHDSGEAARPLGGVSAPAAKGAVQSEVWKNRDKKWIKLEGEGRQEAGK